MKVLLDTHTFLWWITDDPRLSARARDVLVDGTNIVLFSVASAWEIVIKAALGRLKSSEDLVALLTEQIRRNAFRVLPIELAHALRVYTLPDLHRDPFDRILVAQALVEQVPVLTADPYLRLYPVQVLW